MIVRKVRNRNESNRAGYFLNKAFQQPRLGQATRADQVVAGEGQQNVTHRGGLVVLHVLEHLEMKRVCLVVLSY